LLLSLRSCGSWHALLSLWLYMLLLLRRVELAEGGGDVGFE
jgi:hypothetical protein